MGIFIRSDNSLNQHIRIKHPEYWNQYLKPLDNELHQNKVDRDFDAEIPKEKVYLKKHSLSTNYDEFDN